MTPLVRRRMRRALHSGWLLDVLISLLIVALLAVMFLLGERLLWP